MEEPNGGFKLLPNYYTVDDYHSSIMIFYLMKKSKRIHDKCSILWIFGDSIVYTRDFTDP